MTDEEKQRELAAHDVDYHTGAVEDGKRDMIDQQILPVWASTQPAPFAYEGSQADQQAVGGGGMETDEDEPGKGHARRDVIGPGAD